MFFLTRCTTRKYFIRFGWNWLVLDLSCRVCVCMQVYSNCCVVESWKPFKIYMKKCFLISWVALFVDTAQDWNGQKRRQAWTSVDDGSASSSEHVSHWSTSSSHCWICTLTRIWTSLWLSRGSRLSSWCLSLNCLSTFWLCLLCLSTFWLYLMISLLCYRSILGIFLRVPICVLINLALLAFSWVKEFISWWVMENLVFIFCFFFSLFLFS